MLFFPELQNWLIENHFHHYAGLNSGLYVSWNMTGSRNKVFTEKELIESYLVSAYNKNQPKK